MLEHVHEEHDVEIASARVILEGSGVGFETPVPGRLRGAWIRLDADGRPAPGRHQRQRHLAAGAANLEHAA